MYARNVIDIDIYRYLKTRTLTKESSRNYRRYLEQFYWYCVDNKIDPDTADAITVQEWFDTRTEWSNAALRHAATALRGFYTWKYGATHPMTQLRVKHVEPPPQRTLDEEEVMKILASLDPTSHSGVRNLAIITLMIDTGLRASEVCNIELSRLDIKKNRIMVRVKGGRWGEAVYFDYTRHCIANWLAIRPFIAQPLCEYLFVSIGGKEPGTKMTRWGLRSTLERICRRAGVEGVSPHVMRRTFATLATEYGAPTRLVQVAGRWKDIRMVETYTRVLQPEKIKPYSVVNRLMGIQNQDPET
jgi:site-specific recombinase XerD